MKYIYKTLIAIMTLLICNSTMIAQVSPAERQALIDFYNATDGDNWTNTVAGNQPWLINDPTSLVSDWFGIGLDINNRVSTLQLRDNNLVGTLPASINQFFLFSLDLQNNQISGSIPLDLSNQTELQSVKLNDNQLSGSLIGLNLPRLHTIYLHNNLFSGSLPSQLADFENLLFLNLNGNQFSGEIPVELSQLSNLKHLDLDNNQLSGNIPVELSQMIGLERLSLRSNQLSGMMPKELGQLTNLIELRLNNNKLAGTIPSELGLIPRLNTLDLAGNQFSGKVPLLIGQQSTSFISAVRLGNNQFRFSDLEEALTAIAINIRSKYKLSPQPNVDQIETLAVEENKSITLTSSDLTSPNNTYQWYKDNVAIPGATEKDLVITDAKEGDAGVYYFSALNSIVSSLRLNRNPITLTVTPATDTCGVSEAEKQALIDLYNSTDGANWTNNTNWLTDAPVCDWFGVTVVDGKVVGLSFSNNGLDGTLPDSFGNLIHLKSIVIVINRIRGPLPDVFGNLVNVETFTLERNAISGDIPPSIGGMAALKVLNLGSNGFTGNIPSALGNLPNLTNLSLFANQLSGTIPASLGNLSNLERLILFRNRLEGVIPATIGNLSNLTVIDLNYNVLTGSIPAELGDLQNLEALNFSVNRLTGTIPSSFGQLLNLESLYLNQNQLDGQIPSELGQMSSLKNMYLHTNKLTGNIPSSFGGLSSLEVLFLAANELTGSIPSELGQLTGLVDLRLHRNQLSGNIPAELGQMTGLQIMYLNTNTLSGSIPSTFGGLSSLQNLHLMDNELMGSIPSGLDQLTSFKDFRIDQNEFVFNHLTEEFDALKNKLNVFNYFPQGKVDQAETLSVGENGSITLTSTELTSPNNSYQWYKTVNGTTTAIAGATNKDLVIANATDTDAGIYHFTATNNIVTDLTLTRNPITLTISEDTCGVSESEKQALIDLYNSTDGANWTNNTNWLTDAPVCDWYGVTGVADKITGLTLENNNLNGTIAASLVQLSSLEQLNLNGNNLSGTIPNLTGLSALEYLGIQNNGFVFSDFEAEFNSYATLGRNNFIYTPQTGVTQEENVVIKSGESFTFQTAGFTSLNNQYQWYKGEDIISGATNRTYTIEGITDQDSGIYRLEVTNTVVTGLSVYGTIVNLSIDPVDPTFLGDCDTCKSFKPEAGQYVISGWVKEEQPEQVENYTNTAIVVNLTDNTNTLNTQTFTPSGNIIDGWQRITGKFTIPDNTIHLGLDLVNGNTSGEDVDTPVDYDEYFVDPPISSEPVLRTGYLVKFFRTPADCGNDILLQGNINISSNYYLEEFKLYKIIGSNGSESFIEVQERNAFGAPNFDSTFDYTLSKIGLYTCRELSNLPDGDTNTNPSVMAYFDDIRVHPYNGNMKSFVYDPKTQRLMAELDENNYATFYEYDQEGGLIRVKKETEKGIYTIQETRSSSARKQ